MRVFQVEVRLEVLGIIDWVILAGDDVIKSLTLLMAFECGLVELVIDCFILLVINKLVQDRAIFQRLFLIVIALEEFLFGSGQIDLSLELVFFLVILVLQVVGLGLWLQVKEV